MCSCGSSVDRMQRTPHSPSMRNTPSVRGTAALMPGTVQVGAAGRCSAVSLFLCLSLTKQLLQGAGGSSALS